MKVINIFGGPGSGKSTTAAGLFYNMKLAGKNVELVTEFAKDLVWDGRLSSLLDSQEYIFAEQNHRLHRLRGKVDYVITDSPLLLSLVYATANDTAGQLQRWEALDAFRVFVREVVRTYDNINFLLTRPNTYQQVGRAHTLEQANEVDQKILDCLDTFAKYQAFEASGSYTVTAIDHAVSEQS